VRRRCPSLDGAWPWPMLYRPSWLSRDLLQRCGSRLPEGYCCLFRAGERSVASYGNKSMVRSAWRMWPCVGNGRDESLGDARHVVQRIPRRWALTDGAASVSAHHPSCTVHCKTSFTLEKLFDFTQAPVTVIRLTQSSPKSMSTLIWDNLLR
jgi:hypothetical protein